MVVGGRLSFAVEDGRGGPRPAEGVVERASLKRGGSIVRQKIQEMGLSLSTTGSSAGGPPLPRSAGKEGLVSA